MHLAPVLIAAAVGLPSAPPASVGMSASRLAKVDAAIEASIANRECPGAVVLVERHGRVVYRKAYGNRALLPAREPMTVDTIFDMASLTKVLATAPSVMTLVEDGKVRLQDRVAKFIPEFVLGGGARDQVTVEELLTHRAGLAPDDPMALYTGSREEIFERKYRQPLASAPGSRFVYSDVGYEVLGELVERVSGERLDEYAAKHVFEPLGMKETGFRPLDPSPSSPSKKSSSLSSLPLSRIAPTERINGVIRRGAVHDPRAYALGGVAGHAGLFSTADDVARFCAAMLKGGGGVLSPAGVASMMRPRFFGDANLRGLGWDVETHFSSNRGDLFPLGSVGHTGWTGTSVWLDPTTDTFVVLLTNRNHPDESGNVIALRGRVASIVASAITDRNPEELRKASEATALLAAIGAATSASKSASAPSAPAPAARSSNEQDKRGAPSAPSSKVNEAAAAPARVVGQVRPGIDTLEEKSFEAIKGLKVALLTNQTGLTRDGRSTIDVLLSEKAKAAGVSLLRLFSPEHGIRGALDEKVSDSVDEKTGLPVRSLYGDTPESRRPSSSDLAGLDAVVVDLQDAGCRFYTYLTTLGYVLEEAAKAKVKVVVLDRPDPIRADVMGGAARGPRCALVRRVSRDPDPDGNDDRRACDPLQRRAEDRGGPDGREDVRLLARPLVRRDGPAVGEPVAEPALRHRGGALSRASASSRRRTSPSGAGRTCRSSSSARRGWTGRASRRRLNARGIPGVRFTPVRFTPSSSVFKGETCSGVRITLVDRDALNAVALGFHAATALRDLHPNEWKHDRFDRLLVNAAALARFNARRDGRRDHGRLGGRRDGVRGEAGEVPALLTLRGQPLLLELHEDRVLGVHELDDRGARVL